MIERLVILGNGGAAVNAVKGARASGYRGEICLVSDTDTPAFNPMLSPYYLKGTIPWERCFPFGAGFYRDYAVTCVFGSAVESLDAMSQQIRLENGRIISYDRCLVATGASPVIPPVPGLRGSPKAHVVRTPDSIRALEAVLGSAKRAIVLGASFVGLKVAEILIKRHLDVVVMDVAGQVLPRGAHPAVAAILGAFFERHGARLRLGCTIEGMEGSGDGVCCYLSDSITEEADLVVVCTGVRPNADFLDPGQVRMDQAIITDERMATSAPNLYASGDVCQGMEVLTGTSQWMGTWGNACKQGWVAGCNMAGKDVSYPGAIPENVSPFFEWTYAQIGYTGSTLADSGEPVVFGEKGKEEYGVLVSAGGIPVGANLVNCTHLSGMLRRAVVTRSLLRHREEWDSGRSTAGIEASLRKMEGYSPRYAFFT